MLYVSKSNMFLKQVSNKKGSGFSCSLEKMGERNRGQENGCSFLWAKQHSSLHRETIAPSVRSIFTADDL